MVKQITETTVQLVLRELFEITNDDEGLERSLTLLSSVLRTGYLRGAVTHAKCVVWHELDAVETLNESGRDAGLIAVLARIKGQGQNLRTVGQICSMTEDGFIQAGNATDQDVRNFKDWVRSTIPDTGWIMLQVFRHRGLHVVDRHAMIHYWLDVDLV